MFALADLLLPAIRLLDPETAHRLTVRALGAGLGPRANKAPDPILASTVFGIGFTSPVGTAAGFDKDAEAFAGLIRLGAGFVEVGTMTPRPQPGNPKPRVFRLVEDEAVINRYGFNNAGLGAGAKLLARRDRTAGIIGANVGANKGVETPEADYAEGVRVMSPLADYLTINVSSPNTPGLRDLQQRGPLTDLLAAVLKARNEAPEHQRPPVLLKIAPDLEEAPLADVVEVALTSGIDGMIVSNTTVHRPDGLLSAARSEQGGLSGRPLFEPSTRILAQVYNLTEGRMPLIGVGGVDSGRAAYDKIRAGASLVQLYSALVYKGPGLIIRIQDELASLLRADGFERIADAVGVDAKNWARKPA
jgi:dihydroorotate dehydrogenase